MLSGNPDPMCAMAGMIDAGTASGWHTVGSVAMTGSSAMTKPTSSPNTALRHRFEDWLTDCVGTGSQMCFRIYAQWNRTGHCLPLMEFKRKGFWMHLMVFGFCHGLAVQMAAPR